VNKVLRYMRSSLIRSLHVGLHEIDRDAIEKALFGAAFHGAGLERSRVLEWLRGVREKFGSNNAVVSVGDVEAAIIAVPIGDVLRDG
jgi:hypothetical protein